MAAQLQSTFRYFGFAKPKSNNFLCIFYARPFFNEIYFKIRKQIQSGFLSLSLACLCVCVAATIINTHINALWFRQSHKTIKQWIAVCTVSTILCKYQHYRIANMLNFVWRRTKKKRKIISPILFRSWSTARKNEQQQNEINNCTTEKITTSRCLYLLIMSIAHL